MKTALKIKLLISASFFSLIATQSHAQETQEMSKDQLVSMYVNLIEQSKEFQESAELKTEEKLKENLSEEDFAKYKADTKARELAQKTEMANCMGISVDKADSLLEDVGADFQLKSVKECSSELPEKITITDMSNMSANQDLKGFSDCIAFATAKKTGVSEDKLKSCAQLN